MSFEPLEIKNAILKELNLQIIADDKGRRFPHPGIDIQLLAPEDEQRNKFQMAFADNDVLRNAVYEYLKEPRCLRATPFVEISFIEQTDDAEMLKKHFLLRYIAQRPPAEREVYLEVLEGYANRKQMRLINDETYIGRCQKVVNKHGVIERINDLYFPDVREIKGKVLKKIRDFEHINNSVSRLHAHIKLVGGNHYLFDDESSRGTTILPEGRGKSETIDSFSGKKLNHNDIVSFGKAVVRIRVVKKT